MFIVSYYFCTIATALWSYFIYPGYTIPAVVAFIHVVTQFCCVSMNPADPNIRGRDLKVSISSSSLYVVYHGTNHFIHRGTLVPTGWKKGQIFLKALFLKKMKNLRFLRGFLKKNFADWSDLFFPKEIPFNLICCTLLL